MVFNQNDEEIVLRPENKLYGYWRDSNRYMFAKFCSHNIQYQNIIRIDTHEYWYCHIGGDRNEKFDVGQSS